MPTLSSSELLKAIIDKNNNDTELEIRRKEQSDLLEDIVKSADFYKEHQNIIKNFNDFFVDESLLNARTVLGISRVKVFESLTFKSGFSYRYIERKMIWLIFNNKEYKLTNISVNISNIIDSLNSKISIEQTIYELDGKVYVNGVSQGDLIGTVADLSQTGDLEIGDSLLGNAANYQIYNRALSSPEVLHNYNALKGRFGLWNTGQ